ncbi:diguanylate cyclase [Leifsonia sp. SIMBA_070]|uniref:diguanylate cyclase n=1 Tax=Leifsonia sp. SIMBA_070 TaxID=3085810 RepID=UPI00397BA221
MKQVQPDDLPCGLVVVDESGRIIEVNSVFAQWAGTSPEEITGRALDDFLLSQDGPLGQTHRIRHDDAAERPVVTSQMAAGDRRLVALVDAAERTQYEAHLIQQNARMERMRGRLEVILEASSAFGNAKSETELAEILCATAAKAFQAEDSVVFLTNGSGQLEQIAGTHPLAGAIPPGSLVAAVQELDRVVTISGTEEGDKFDPVIGAAMRSRGVQAILAAPFRSGGLLRGVLSCFFRRPREFDDEVAPVAGSLVAQAGQVIKTLGLQRRLEHLAFHDEVTGLPNRRLLNLQLQDSVRTGHDMVAALFLDLDGFKAVNDTYGHHIGDLLLREVAHRLNSTVRQHDFVARYGGDEFVILSEVRDIEAAHTLADRIRHAINAPYGDLPATVSIQASIGMSLAPLQGNSWNPDYLIRLADHAMYAAKNAGGNRTVDVLLTGVTDTRSR